MFEEGAMNNVVRFPAQARIASNDAHMWSSTEHSSDAGAVTHDFDEKTPYARPCKIIDKVSGVEYIGYVIDDEKQSGGRFRSFVIGIVIWLIILALI
jgi:hypothetical protein